MSEMSSERRYRLVVLGSGRAGKTSLIKQYLYKEFSDKYRETVEDLHCRQFRIHGVTLSLDILDTNFNYPDMRRLAISTASAFLLVFAVDDVHSFKQMSDLWTEICLRRLDIATVPIVIAGNKADILLKKIYFETAQSWISRLQGKVRYVETSAKTDTNVTDIFRNLLELSGFPFNKNRDISQVDVAREVRLSASIRRHHSMRARHRHRSASKQSETSAETRQQTIRQEASLLFRVLSLSPQNRRRSQRCKEQQSMMNRAKVAKKLSDCVRDQQGRERLLTWAGSFESTTNDHQEKTTPQQNQPNENGVQSRNSTLTSLKRSFRERSRHLSLKMRRRRGDADFDESNCKIS